MDSPAPSNNTPDYSSPAVDSLSVKERFNYTKEKYEKQQKEKINKIKHNPRESILRSINTEEEVSAVDENTDTHKFLKGETSPNSLWKNTLDDLKDQQENRFFNEKTTQKKFCDYISNYNVATRRITEWEEVSVQIEATSSELAHAWRVVKPLVEESHVEDWSYLLKDREEEKIAKAKKEGKKIVEEADYNKYPQPFTVGSTRIFPATLFGPEIHDYLDSLLQGREKYISLDAGVQSNRGHKPPIRIVTLITRNPYDKKIYISFLISAHDGYEYCDACYGDVSIAVFKHHSNERLFYKRFYLVWSIESLIQEIEEGNSEEIPDLMTLEEIESQNQNDEIVNVAPFSSPENKRGSMRLSSSNKSPFTSPTTNRQSVRVATPFSSPLVPVLSVFEDEQTLEESIKNDKTHDDPIEEEEEAFHSEDEEYDHDDEKKDEEMLKILHMSIIPVTAEELKKQLAGLDASSFYDDFEDGGDYNYEDLYARPSSTRKIFYKRIKGVDIQGYIYKYHDTLKGLIPSSKKYFILRDNYLSYHKDKVNIDPNDSLKSFKGITITKDTEIARLFPSGLKIQTPKPRKSVYLNLRRDSAKERLWISAITQTIQIEKQKYALAKAQKNSNK